MSNSAWLIQRGVPTSLWAYQITQEHQVVGRSEACDICVLHPSVSRQHAEFWCRGEEIFVRDLGSRNGTFVDGVPIDKIHVAVGSEVQLGEAKLEVVAEAAFNNSTSVSKNLPTTSIESMNDELKKLLTPAEFRVLSLLMKGYSENKAAEELFLTKNTVHTHVMRIYQKLDVHSSKELMAKFLSTATD